MTTRSDVTDTLSHRPRTAADPVNPYGHLWDYSSSPTEHRAAATDSNTFEYPLASLSHTALSHTALSHTVRELDHDHHITPQDDPPSAHPVEEALHHGAPSEPVSAPNEPIWHPGPIGEVSPTALGGNTIEPTHQPPMPDPPVRAADISSEESADIGSEEYAPATRSRRNQSYAKRRNRRRPARGPWSSAPVLLRAIVTAGLIAATGVSVVRAQGGEADGRSSAAVSGAAANSLTDDTAVQACRVRHSIASRLAQRFTSVVTITNTGQTAVTGWTLRWAYPDQGPEAVPKLSNGWNSAVSADALGGQAIDVEASRVIPAGGSVTIAFAGTSSQAVPAPTDFTLNGVRCR